MNWLEELRDLSNRFPSPRDAVVLRMSMRPSQGAGGLIDLQGLVRDPKVVVNLERQVRDDFRTVRSRRVQQRTQEDDYTWLYETSVSVAPRRPDQYAVQPATGHTIRRGVSMSKKPRRKTQKKQFPSILLVLGGVFLAISVFLFARQGGGVGTPSIAVDQLKIDYGDVKFNVEKTFAVKVTNTGDGTLRFKEEPYIEVLEGC